MSVICATKLRARGTCCVTHWQTVRFDDTSHAAAKADAAAGSGLLKASMDGAIVDVVVAEGERVSRGQTLVVLEAMKMEHPLKADMDGTVAAIHCQAGDQVKSRQLLVELNEEAL